MQQLRFLGLRLLTAEKTAQYQYRRRLVHRTFVTRRLLSRLPQQSFSFHGCKPLIHSVDRHGGFIAQGSHETFCFLGLRPHLAFLIVGYTHHNSFRISVFGNFQKAIQVLGQLGPHYVTGGDNQVRPVAAHGQADSAVPKIKSEVFQDFTFALLVPSL